jgi:7-cyano-7-deazaguanine synthase in queuosine biosynthesis
MNSSPVVVLCNQASPPRRRVERVVNLSYLKTGSNRPNVIIGLPKLVQSLYHLSDRVLDLIEIACYVFAADRHSLRGQKDALEYHSWARNFEFYIKVRDYSFWNNHDVKIKLSEALRYMTGDNSYSFNFQRGHTTPQVDLFDSEEFCVDSSVQTEIALFSGGLDSLVGAIQLLESGVPKVCLVSHRSGQPETIRTQDKLHDALEKEYPNRIRYYKFRSGLKEQHAKEETQRTRSFLFSSIAFALASAYRQDHFYIFENGVTSMNFPRREDLKNARASRTTHPKTIFLLKEFLSTIENKPVDIRTPFFWRTKTDVLNELKQYGKERLLPSSVSCSKTFQPFNQGTHCGICYQCLDRRFAVYGSELNDTDNKALYNTDFITEGIPDSESKTGLFGYVQQAKDFATLNGNAFYNKYLPELSEIVDYIEGEDENKKTINLAELCKRHGEQVWHAAELMRKKHDALLKPLVRGSFLDILSRRDHLKEPIERLINDISCKLDRAIPVLYRTSKPKNENKLNDAIQAFLLSEKNYFDREYPTIAFALCRTIPDHSWKDRQLLIETKYLRGNLTLPVLTNQIGADLFKYPKESKVLFVLYDPQRKIFDDVKFTTEIQSSDMRCIILIIR